MLFSLKTDVSTFKASLHFDFSFLYSLLYFWVLVSFLCCILSFSEISLLYFWVLVSFRCCIFEFWWVFSPFFRFLILWNAHSFFVCSHLFVGNGNLVSILWLLLLLGWFFLLGFVHPCLLTCLIKLGKPKRPF